MTDIIMSLQHLAMVKISQCVWKVTSAEGDLKFILEDSEDLEIGFKEDMELYVLSKIEKLSLPSDLKSQLLYIVKEMGSEIFRWNEHITKSNQIYPLNQRLNFNEKLYWTSIGLLDIKKMIVENWLSDTRREVQLRVLEECLEYGVGSEHVHRLWQSLTESEKEEALSVEGHAAAFFYIFREWENMKKYVEGYNLSLDHKMLSLFIEAGFSELVKNLWVTFDDEKKDSIIIRTFEAAYKKIRLGDCFQIKRYEEICIFLFSKMNEMQKFEVVSDQQERGWKILDLLIMWPWIDLLIPTLEVVWINNQYKLDAKKSVDVIEKLVLNRLAETHYGYSSMLLTVIKNVWKMVPAQVKSELNIRKIVSDFIASWSLDDLKYLVIAQETQKEKYDVTEIIVEAYLDCRFEHGRLDGFVRKVFHDHDDRLDFVRRLIKHRGIR